MLHQSTETALMIQSNVKFIMEQKKITYAMLESATGLSSQTITRARGPRIREISLDKLPKPSACPSRTYSTKEKFTNIVINLNLL